MRRVVSQFPIFNFCFAQVLISLLLCLSSPAATITWTNSAGGNWNTAANWSPNQVPGPADTAILANSAAITLTSPNTISNFNQSNGSIKGSAVLTVTGTMNWTGGDLGGLLTIAGGATLNISNAVSLGSSGSPGTLTNNGTVVWAATAGAPLYGYGGAVIFNAGLWQSVVDGVMQNQSGSNVFMNAGTLQKAGGSGSTSFSWSFNTTGIIDTQTGNFSISAWTGNNTLNGTNRLALNTLTVPLTVASNAVLNWLSGDIGGGSMTIAAGATVTISNSVSLGGNSQGGAITNFGTFIWAASAGAPLYGYGNSIVHNAGLWQSTLDGSMPNQSGSNTFVNVGTLQKAGGTGNTSIGWAFNSTGTLDTQTGRFAFPNWSRTSTIHGAPTISGSVLFGSLTIPASETLNAASLDVRGSLVVASNALMNWGNGDVSGGNLNISAGGTLNISNSISFGGQSVGGSLTNAGTVVWNATAGAPLYGYGASTIYNSGLWQCTVDGTIPNQSGTNFFYNAGTLQKTGGTGTTSIAWRFNNTGVMTTSSGSFSLSQWAGTNTFAGNAVVQWSGSVNTLTILSNAVLNWKGGDISGGTLLVSPGATLAISNAVSLGYNNGAGNGGGTITNYGTTIWGGVSAVSAGYGGAIIHNAGLWQAVADNTTLTVNQGSNIFVNAGTLQKIGGSSPSVINWWFNSTGTIDTPVSSLTLNQWQGNNTLHGSPNLVVGTMNASLIVASNATLNWISGDIGTGAMMVNAGGSVTFSNAGFTIGYNNGPGNGAGTLTNYGNVIWAGTSVASYGFGGAIIHNAGTWQSVASSTTLASNQGSNTFINTGTLQKLGGSSASVINWWFNSTGTIDTPISSFTLNQWQGASVIHGTPNLSVGTMNASLTVASNSTLNWINGDIGTGAMMVNAGGSVTFSNAGFTIGYNNGPGNGAGTLTNYGRVIWAGASVVSYGFGGAIIHNAGAWQSVAGGTTLAVGQGSNTFINTGTLQKLAGVSATTINWPFRNSGIVDVQVGALNFGGAAIQTAGLTLMEGGNLTFNQPFQLAGGTLAGTNTVNGTVTNSAIVSPGASPGILTINGNYIQTPSGALNIELAGTNAGSQYDRLAISPGNSATLAGALNITLVDPFQPALSNTFRVMTWNSFSGGFDSINGLVFSTNLLLQATYLSTALDLVTATNSSHLVTPPSIVTQPQSQSLINGQTANFLVTAAGTRPVAYQWRLNGSNLSGATTSTLTIPNVQTNSAGNYQAVVTNTAGAATSQVAVLTVIPIADLVVTDVSNPTNANAGQPFSVTWRSLNQGGQTAPAPWIESVALSTNAGGSSPLPIASFVYTNTLGPNQSIARTQTVIAPGGLDGTFYVVITTDSGNQVYEDVNETNNTTVGTNSIRLRSPDLQPIALSASPASAQFGASIPFSWFTTNSGSGPAQVVWADRVYLNNLSSSLSGALPLASLSIASVPLAAGAAISNYASLAIPLSSTSSNGAYYLIVSSDDDNTIAESRETNNLASRPITLSLPPLPDLFVTNIATPTQWIAGVAMPIQWTTTNGGTANIVSNAWTESVIASNASAVITLAEFRFTKSLNFGDSISRTQSVVFPSTLIAGDYRILVTADSLDEIIESHESNNTSLATNATTLPSQLTLTLPLADVNEGDPPFTASVSRNGSLASDLLVTITNGPPGSLALSNSVTIPAGAVSATFAVQALLDGIVNADRLVIIGVGATNYNPDAAGIVVHNIDQPSLALSFDSPLVPEGASVNVTVSRAPFTNGELTVALASSDPLSVSLPSSMLIPSNQTSVSFSLPITDDNLVTGIKTNIITAFAGGFNSASAPLAIMDNDLAAVTLTLAQNSVSEGAGPAATMGTVTRSFVSTAPMVLDLTSSDPNSVRVPSPVVIPAGSVSYSFPIAAIDNAIVDSNRVVQLRVFIRATGSTADIAEGTGATLTVVDDDGPSLRIDLPHDVVAENLNPAMAGTVTRNTGTNSSLLVNLNSSRTDKATVPATVTIPAGATSAPFNITTISNGVADGNQTVTLAATASGYGSGSKTFVVSDINLPDLAVTQLTVPTNGLTEAFFTVSYRLANQGFASSGTNLVTRFYLSTDPILGGDTVLGDATIAGPIPAGNFLGQSLQFRLPVSAGQYWVIAVTDPDGQISEIREDNNVAVTTLPITVNPAYTATVQAPFATAVIPTNVPLTGTATLYGGGPAQFVPVSLHIFVRGTERVIQAITDNTGHFSTVFHPLPTEAGNYQVGAAHPGDVVVPPQATFALLGMKTSPASSLIIAITGSSATGAVDVVNLGDTPLTGLSAIVASGPGNLTITPTLSTNRIEAQGTIQLKYSVTALDASQPQGIVQLHVASAEGASTDETLGVAVWPATSRLACDQTSLKAAMPIGGQQRVQFAIMNQGGAASGPITISVPSLPWLAVGNANPLPSLAPGASNIVTLVLTPAADLPLGPYTGTIVVSAQSSSLNLPFNFLAMSQLKGDLTVQVQDEFTFYAAGSPLVTNASVTIIDPVSLATVTNGYTGTNGFVTFAQLPEAWYNVEITEPNHSSYKGVVLVHGGTTNVLQAFISRQLVTYSWAVVPTTVQDRTRITIQTTFETFVPAPVVTVDPPMVDLADYTNDFSQISLVISNHGLIAAQDVKIYPVSHPNWLITPLVTDLGILPANGSLTVPVTLQRVNHSSSQSPIGKNTPGKDTVLSTAACIATVALTHGLPCGGVTNQYGQSVPFMNAGDCFGFAGGVPGGGGGGGGGNHGSTNSSSGGNTSGAGGWSWWPHIEFPPIPLPGLPFVNQPQHPTPPACSCEKLPKSCFEVEASGSILGSAASAVANFLKGVPGLEVGFEISGKAELCLCCDSNGMGLKLEGSGGIEFNGSADIPIAGHEFSGSKTVGAYTMSYSVGAECTAKPSVSGGGSVNGSTECHLSNPKICAEANLSASLNLGCEATGEATISSNGVVLGKQGLNLSASITGGVKGNASYCLDKGLKGQICVDPVMVHLGGGLSFAGVDFHVSDDFQISSNHCYPDTPNPIAAQLASKADAEIHAQLDLLRNQGITKSGGPILSGSKPGKFSSDGVCARVKVRLDQDLVLTRNAFAATLELDNGSATDTLTNIQVILAITDANGIAANEMFAFSNATVIGMGAVDGTGLLPPNSVGSATWTLIPTRAAAPDGPVTYGVGGILQYSQAGQTIVVPLFSAPITVNPDPALFIKYFHQRDVFSDDPFTEPIEPAIPYVLGVMVENRGKGDANNVRIISGQPKIVDNEKGLLIDFKIIGTQVAGKDQTASLTADFGNILPSQRGIGLWYLTSTLQGSFFDYSATFQHIDDLGKTNLSLVDEVTIHEMLHLVQAPGSFEDGLPDFLVNDILDEDHLPDHVYLSNGATNPVAAVTQASVDAPASPGHLQVQLTASMPSGFVYLRANDPGNGQYLLTRVVRSDSIEIYLNTNVWTTDRTFIEGGHRPIYENKLHLFDYNSTGSYTLYYAIKPPPDTNAPTSSVAALPANSYPSINLSWSGADDVGIAFFDIFVSADGGPFQPWLAHTTLNASTYQGQFGHGYAFYSLATDAAGNRQSPPIVPDAQTFVSLSNSPPSMIASTNITIDEATTLSVSLAATDPDPGQTLAYTLLGAPAGLTVNASGVLTWPTSEATGPSTNAFSVVASDNGIPALSATSAVTVIVREVNSAPVLPAIASRTINEGFPLSITNHAVDTDIPANTLTYSLLGAVPAGATLNATNGIFRWTPDNTQGPSTNPITIVVTDNGSPVLSATQVFTVVVRDVLSDFTLSLGSTNVAGGESNTIPIVLRSSLPLTNITLNLASSSSLLTNLGVRPLNSEVTLASLSPLGSNTYSLNFNLDPNQQTLTTRSIATLDFLSVASNHSSIVLLSPSQLLAGQSSGPAITNGAALSSRVIIISPEPILELGLGSPLTLALYGKAGTNYLISSTTNITLGPWIIITNLSLTNNSRTIVVPSPAPSTFYRALQQ